MRGLLDDPEDIRPSSDVSLPRDQSIRPPEHPITIDSLLNLRIYKTIYGRHLLLAVLIIYLTLRVVRYLKYKIMNNIVTNMGREAFEMRNGRLFSFRDEIQNLDVDGIIKLDVLQLRKGLFNGDFTSVNLVNVFSERCYTIGRGLNLTTQENFKTALRIA